MSNLLTSLQSYTDSVVSEYQIPAISIAVWCNSTCHKAAAGILNIETGVKATSDSIFQIGSITKVFTGSLVMQLVDENKIELDVPVKNYLRDFTIGDTNATNTITVRQLLDHTSGIAGDYFPNDLSANGNAIARYIDRINLLPLVHPPGTMFSYSNAAFAVAGRITEILMGCSWYNAMVERIFQPLGMRHSIADPKEALRYRVAMGHLPAPDDPSQWCLQAQSYSCLGLAPAGTTPAMSAADLITFARAHLSSSHIGPTMPFLSADCILEMQKPTVALPKNSERFDRYRGLCWSVFKDKVSDTLIVEHAGQVGGQVAMLRMFPEEDIAFAILLNGRQNNVLDLVINDLTKDLIGIDIKEPNPTPISLDTPSLQLYVGSFESFDAVYCIRLKDGEETRLIMSRTDKLHKITHRYLLLPIGRHIFAVYAHDGLRQANIVFIETDGNRPPTHLFVGGRINQRQ